MVFLFTGLTLPQHLCIRQVELNNVDQSTVRSAEHCVSWEVATHCRSADAISSSVVTTLETES